MRKTTDPAEIFSRPEMESRPEDRRYALTRSIRLVSEGSMDFVLNGDHAVMMRYSGREAHVTVPEHIRDLPVTQVAAGAFEGNEDLVSVVLPAGIRVLGDAAFRGCRNLKSLSTFPMEEPTTPEGRWLLAQGGHVSRLPRLAYIGEEACRYTALENLEFFRAPDRILIGASAFQNCACLRQVNVPGCEYLEVGHHAFGACRELELLSAPRARVRLGQYAFGHCENLTFCFFSGMPEADGTVFYCCPKLRRTGKAEDGRFWIDPAGQYRMCRTVKVRVSEAHKNRVAEELASLLQQEDPLGMEDALRLQILRKKVAAIVKVEKSDRFRTLGEHLEEKLRQPQDRYYRDTDHEELEAIFRAVKGENADV